jgi:hypothetical protein
VLRTLTGRLFRRSHWIFTIHHWLFLIFLFQHYPQGVAAGLGYIALIFFLSQLLHVQVPVAIPEFWEGTLRLNTDHCQLFIASPIL